MISYAGWNRCLKIDNDTMEVVVTMEVGPRIIRCGFIGDENHFVEYADQTGKKGDSAYHSYGGHRLWIAPEEHPKTIYPDNAPVELERDGEWFHFTPPVEKSTGFQKEIDIWLDPDRNKVRVLHRITNRSKDSLTGAAWGVTVMAPSGRAVVPHERYKPHPESLLPVRPLVLWSYTDMSDPRWKWGKRFIQLHQDRKAKEPQKIGMLNTDGWCAYENRGQLFVKSFACQKRERYPDFGSNCEIFTNAKMLELESLSPLKDLSPGDSLTHEEQWYLFDKVNLGSSNDEIAYSIQPLIEQCT